MVDYLPVDRRARDPDASVNGVRLSPEDIASLGG
jgi:hypothetical protein